MNSNTITFTAEELCAKYNIAVSTLKQNFTRTCAMLEKKHGVKLSKSGRGKNTYYYISSFEHSDPSRALTIYDSLESNNIPLEPAARLLDLHFLVFIGIVSSPQRAFRGSYTDLLSYLDIPISPQEIENVKNVLTHLVTCNYIMYMEDPSNPMYFMASIQWHTEEVLKFELNALLAFQKMVEGTRKSWIPLMKVYFALHLLEQPCTVSEITQLTQLSEYKVRDSLLLLEQNNIIIRDKQTGFNQITHKYYCAGTDITINAFGIE